MNSGDISTLILVPLKVLWMVYEVLYQMSFTQTKLLDTWVQLDIPNQITNQTGFSLGQTHLHLPCWSA